MKFFTKEVKIALVAILGIVVLYYGLTFLKSAAPLDAVPAQGPCCHKQPP